jgi:hypothetical protein
MWFLSCTIQTESNQARCRGDRLVRLANHKQDSETIPSWKGTDGIGSESPDSQICSAAAGKEYLTTAESQIVFPRCTRLTMGMDAVAVA